MLQMVAGLGGETSSLLMIPSMVDIIPSGCAKLSKWALPGGRAARAELFPACRDERGRYLALDLGGTNFRCVYIKLGNGKGQIVRNLACMLSWLCVGAVVAFDQAVVFIQEDVKIEQCEIPEHHFTSPAADLFTFMAEKMVTFAKTLGFTR